MAYQSVGMSRQGIACEHVDYRQDIPRQNPSFDTVYVGEWQLFVKLTLVNYRMPSPELRALQRRQLDRKVAPIRGLGNIGSPRKGWIQAIRTALGMSAAQLGKRLGITRQAVLDMERREAEETITMGRLRDAAEAMNCQLLIAMLPRTTLEDAVRRQAASKAIGDRERLLHSMRLEGQESGVDEALDMNERLESWLTRHHRRLWD